MTVVVLGIDALDPDLLEQYEFPNLRLTETKRISTISSTANNEPSTHELWPTIITGLPPEEHGIQLDDGLSWENPILRIGSRVGGKVLPNSVRVRLGAWLLDNTDEGNFRGPASYYEKHGIPTVFDDVEAKPIGIPNYVVDRDDDDREHELRKNMGDLFQLDLDDDTEHHHVTSDPNEFYELCLEMSMIRIARVRRALRSERYELVFGYTSGLDLVGHIAYAEPGLQRRAYNEFDDFVGELRNDLGEDDELILVSDHGLQSGEHTDEAAISATNTQLIENVDGVLDIKSCIEAELARHNHQPDGKDPIDPIGSEEGSNEVREHLEDLGYM